jgi:hypothetical protein
MATFNEIYQSYLQNPYAGVNAIAPAQGIGSLQAQPSIAYSGDGTTTAAPTTTGVPSTFQPTKMDMVNLLFSPVMGIANIMSRRATGLSLAERAMDAMGIGRGPGGRTEGYGVDSMAGMTSGPTHGVDDVNSQSVAADASAGGAAGAAAASAAGANDGPATGGSFAKGGRVGYAEGSITQEGVIPGFTKLKNPDGAPGNYNEFMYEGPDGQIYGAGTYSSIAAGQYPNIYDPSKNTTVIEQTTPTEDFSDYLNQSIDATEKPSIPYEQYVLRTQGVPVSEEVYNASNILAPDGYLGGFTSEQEFNKARNELVDQMIAQKKAKDELAAGLYQTTDPNIIGYSPSEPSITALPQAQQTAPTVAEQMMSPEDALTPEVPQENPIQKHLDFNEFLKGQGLSQQDYNVLGGYDVAQNLAPGNPILGGAINLASPVYNAIQMFDSAKDAQGNVIKQYVPDMYEDATESGAYYTVPAQKISDIPGSAARNIQGGLGLLSDRQKQSYQDLRNQYETQRQKSAFERFTGAAGPLAENINTAISSLNPFQQQQYMQYATQNPEQAIAAAQQNKDFLAATQRENQATGGRIGYSNGSSGQDYWITVQEMYDNAGGEAGTGLGLIDFANKYFPKMADGGRVFYLQGGLASLLG